MSALRRRWHGCRNRFILALLALVLACALLCMWLWVAHQKASATALESPGWDVLLLLDHSNSMGFAGNPGSDPELLRLKAAGLFIGRLGIESYPTPHRLGIINFGGSAELVRPLTPLADPENRQWLREGLALPEPMGWTDPLAALQLAYAEFYSSTRTTPERRQAVILLTDGQPALPELQTIPARAAYLAELRQLVARFSERGCAIFTIALSADAIAGDTTLPTVYRNIWQEIAAQTPPGAYYPIAESRALPEVYHAIISKLLGMEPQAPIATLQIAGVRTQTLVVEPGMKQLTLAMFKSDPELQVEVLRPGGALLREEDPDTRHLGQQGRTHEEIWVVTLPRDGRWSVRATGSGEVLLWADTVSGAEAMAPIYSLSFSEIPSRLPSGTPLELTCQLISDAEALPSDIQVTLELRRAGFPEVVLLGQADSEARNFHARTAELQPGVYTVWARALQQGVAVAQAEAAFEIVSLPQLEVITPANGMTQTAGTPLTLMGQITGDWATIAAIAAQPEKFLRVTLPGTESMPWISLTVESTGFVGGAVLPPEVTGVHALTLELHGKTIEGFDFAEKHEITLDISAAPLAVDPPSPARVSVWWPWLGGASLALGLGGGALWRWQQYPRLVGQWRVLAAPQPGHVGTNIPLPARRAMRFPDNRAFAPMLPGVPLPAPVAQLRAERGASGAEEVWIYPLDNSSARLLRDRQPVQHPCPLQDGEIWEFEGYRLRYENVQQAAQRRQRGPWRL